MTKALLTASWTPKLCVGRDSGTFFGCLKKLGCPSKLLDVCNLFARVLRAVRAAAGDDSDVALPGALEAKAEEKPAEEPKAEEKQADQTEVVEKSAEEAKAEEKPAEEPKAEEKPIEPAEEAKAEQKPADEPKAEEKQKDEWEVRKRHAEQANRKDWLFLQGPVPMTYEQWRKLQNNEGSQADQAEVVEKSAEEAKAEEKPAEEPKAEEKPIEQAEVVEKAAEEAKAEEKPAEEPTETFVLPSAGLVFISEGEIEEPPEKAPTRLAQLQKTVGIVAWSRCQHARQVMKCDPSVSTLPELPKRGQGQRRWKTGGQLLAAATPDGIVRPRIAHFEALAHPEFTPFEPPCTDTCIDSDSGDALSSAVPEHWAKSGEEVKEWSTNEGSGSGEVNVIGPFFNKKL